MREFVNQIEKLMAFNTDIQEKPKSICIFIIIGIVDVLIRFNPPFLDWNEGLTASIEIVLAALFVGGVFSLLVLLLVLFISSFQSDTEFLPCCARWLIFSFVLGLYI